MRDVIGMRKLHEGADMAVIWCTTLAAVTTPPVCSSLWHRLGTRLQLIDLPATK